jgi:hypothetical protein
MCSHSDPRATLKHGTKLHRARHMFCHILNLQAQPMCINIQSRTYQLQGWYFIRPAIQAQGTHSGMQLHCARPGIARHTRKQLAPFSHVPAPGVAFPPAHAPQPGLAQSTPAPLNALPAGPPSWPQGRPHACSALHSTAEHTHHGITT